MSAVVRLGDFQNKGTVMLLRELLGKAVRGQVAGVALNVEFKDGTQKTGFTGKYQADPEEALRVANKISQRLNQIRDERQGGEDEEDDDGGDGNSDSGNVRRLRRAP